MRGLGLEHLIEKLWDRFPQGHVRGYEEVTLLPVLLTVHFGFCSQFWIYGEVLNRVMNR